MGLQPSEFWKMSPHETSVYIDTMRPRKSYGRMSEDEAKRITDRIKANPEKYA